MPNIRSMATVLLLLLISACASRPSEAPVVEDVVAPNPAPLGQAPHLKTNGEPRFKTNRLIMVETRPGHYVYCRKRRGILVCYGGS